MMCCTIVLWLLCALPCRTSIVQFQHTANLPTTTSTTAIAFTAANRQYLVVANYGDDFGLDMIATTYRFNDVTHSWETPSPLNFPLPPGGRMSHANVFSMNSHRYLVLCVYANYPLGETDVNSILYQWDDSVKNWALFQRIATMGCMATAFVGIGTSSFLILANQFSTITSSYDVNSRVLRMNPANGLFDIIHQEITTNGAGDVDALVIDGNTYLLLASYKNQLGVFNIDSKMFKWNGALFVLYQLIATVAARRWVTAQIGGNTFALVTGDNTVMYKWDAGLQLLVVFQNLRPQSSGGTFFSMDGGTWYLAVAFSRSGMSEIWRFDTEGGLFVSYQVMATDGEPRDVEAITRGSTKYLVVCQNRGAATRVYRLAGESRTQTKTTESVVPSIEIPTRSPTLTNVETAEWESKVGGDTRVGSVEGLSASVSPTDSITRSLDSTDSIPRTSPTMTRDESATNHNALSSRTETTGVRGVSVSETLQSRSYAEPTSSREVGRMTSRSLSRDRSATDATASDTMDRTEDVTHSVTDTITVTDFTHSVSSERTIPVTMYRVDLFEVRIVGKGYLDDTHLMVKETLFCTGQSVQSYIVGCGVLLVGIVPTQARSWRGVEGMELLATDGGPGATSLLRAYVSGDILSFQLGPDPSYSDTLRRTFRLVIPATAFEPPAPRPVIIPVEITPVAPLSVSATEFILAASSLLAALTSMGHPSLLLFAGRTSHLVRSVTCPAVEEVRLDIASHPTQATLGTAVNTRYFSAALVFNSVIVVGVYAVSIVSALLVWQVRASSTGMTFPDSMRLVAFPTLPNYVSLFFLQTHVSATVYILFVAKGSTEMFVSVLCFLFTVMYVAALVWMGAWLTVWFDATWVPIVREAPSVTPPPDVTSSSPVAFPAAKDRSHYEQRLAKYYDSKNHHVSPKDIDSVLKVFETDNVPYEQMLKVLFQKYGPEVVAAGGPWPQAVYTLMERKGTWDTLKTEHTALFTLYRGPCHRQVFTDVAVSVLLGVVGGANMQCMVSGAVVVVVYVAYIVCVVVRHPYNDRFSSYTFFAITIGHLLCALQLFGGTRASVEMVSLAQAAVLFLVAGIRIGDWVWSVQWVRSPPPPPPPEENIEMTMLGSAEAELAAWELARSPQTLLSKLVIPWPAKYPPRRPPPVRGQWGSGIKEDPNPSTYWFDRLHRYLQVRNPLQATHEDVERLMENFKSAGYEVMWKVVTEKHGPEPTPTEKYFANKSVWSDRILTYLQTHNPRQATPSHVDALLANSESSVGGHQKMYEGLQEAYGRPAGSHVRKGRCDASLL